MSKPTNSGDQESVLLRRHQEGDLRSLFESAQKDNQAALNKLLSKYANIVRTVVGELTGRIDRSTLIDQATQALRLAILKADLNELVKFSAFARTCIRNDLVTLIRELSEGSRSAFESFVEFESAKQAITLLNENNSPNDDEVFEYLRWGKVKRQNFRMSVRARRLGDLSKTDHSRDESQKALEIRTEKENRMEIVCQVMKELPEQQREALERQFFHSEPMNRKDYALSIGETEHEIRKRERLGLSAIKSAIEKQEK